MNSCFDLAGLELSDCCGLCAGPSDVFELVWVLGQAARRALAIHNPPVILETRQNKKTKVTNWSLGRRVYWGHTV